MEAGGGCFVSAPGEPKNSLEGVPPSLFVRRPQIHRSRFQDFPLRTPFLRKRPVKARFQAFSGCQFHGVSSSMRFIL